MMGKLVVWIAEKPKVAAAFAEAMGFSGNKSHAEGAYVSADGNIKFTWAFGHLLRDFQPEEYSEQFKTWDLKTLPIVPEKWRKAVTNFEAAKTQFFKVKKLIEQADEIVLATDFDREGEVIGRELLVYCNYTKPVHRVNITAMDKASLQKTVNSTFDGATGMPLYYAGLARAQVDWLYGINLTRMATILGKQQGMNAVLSAGRVQSAALNIIGVREEEIANFVSKDHYRLKATFTAAETSFSGQWLVPGDLLNPEKLLLDIEPAKAREKNLKGASGTVVRCSANNASEKPFLPYSLSEAQIECANKFGFSPEKTLSLLQDLYDKHHLVSYPRTSCRYLPTGELEDLQATLDSLKAMDPTISETIDGLDTSLRSDAWDDSKVGAHYGLKPTSHRGDLTQLTADELKAYTLIRDSFIIQFMPPAEYRKVSLEIHSSEGSDIFMAKGSTLTAPGWLEYLRPAKDEDAGENEESQEIPELPAGTEVIFDSLAILEQKTKPPRYYTDATLIAIMTNCSSLVKDIDMKRVLKNTCGIGTDATRAAIIKTLFDRNYVVKKGKQIRITELGKAVLTILPAAVKSVENTAYMEQQLEAIADRKLSLDSFRSEMVEKLRVIFTGDLAAINLDKVIPKCPDCDKNLRRIKKKDGDFFWGCTGYPECKKSFNDVKGKPELVKSDKKAPAKRKGPKK
ncbi:DNA topoisomerase 3 [Enterobacter soli]